MCYAVRGLAVQMSYRSGVRAPWYTLWRFYPLTWTGNKFAHNKKKLTDEAIDILGDLEVSGDHAVLEDIRVSIPKRQPSSVSLRLPNIVYELYGGRVRYGFPATSYMVIADLKVWTTLNIVSVSLSAALLTPLAFACAPRATI